MENTLEAVVKRRFNALRRTRTEPRTGKLYNKRRSIVIGVAALISVSDDRVRLGFFDQQLDTIGESR